MSSGSVQTRHIIDQVAESMMLEQRRCLARVLCDAL